MYAHVTYSTVADWFEIIVPATAGIAGDVAALLGDAVAEAARGAQIRGSDVVFWVSGARREEALAEARSAAVHLAASGMSVDADGVTSQPAVPESEWRDAWKRYFRVKRLTRQLVVVPSWEEYEPAPEDIPIYLDPGQAFGTGTHATTRLILDELQSLRDGGFVMERFLDVGSGSGILSIAAAKLWPDSTGVAVDVDALAVDATTDNCAANGVGDRLEVSDTAAEEIAGEFNLVMANIQAGVLSELGTPLAERVAEGGRLLLSGILDHQAAPLALRIAESSDLLLLATRPSAYDPGWAGVLLCRDG